MEEQSREQLENQNYPIAGKAEKNDKKKPIEGRNATSGKMRKGARKCALKRKKKKSSGECVGRPQVPGQGGYWVCRIKDHLKGETPVRRIGLAFKREGVEKCWGLGRPRLEKACQAKRPGGKKKRGAKEKGKKKKRDNFLRGVSKKKKGKSKKNEGVMPPLCVPGERKRIIRGEKKGLEEKTSDQFYRPDERPSSRE